MLWLEGSRPTRVKSAKEDIYELMEANFQHGVVVGKQWEYVNRLHGNLSVDNRDAKRVDVLAAQMSSDKGLSTVSLELGRTCPILEQNFVKSMI